MNVKKLFEEKRDWRAYQSRVKSLPKDYLIVYNEIEKYLFKVCCVEDRDAYSVLPIPSYPESWNCLKREPQWEKVFLP